MIKKELAQRVTARLGVPEYTALKIIDILTDEITEAVKRGDRVDLRGFGTFMRKPYKAKRARAGIGLTGHIVVPAHDEPRFVASDLFRDQVKEPINQAEQ